MRAMFERIGFTSAAASLLTDEQGIDSLAEILNMNDTNIENLCKVLRRPGGQNNSGNADPGVKVSARAEENLNLAAFYCRHQEWVSRQFNVASITLASIRKFIKQRDLERVKFTGVRESPTVNVLRTGRGLWKQSKSICSNSGVRLVCPLITSYAV